MQQVIKKVGHAVTSDKSTQVNLVSKTFLPDKSKSIKQVEQVLQCQRDITRPEVRQEVEMLLVKHGLTIDKILSSYKSIISSPDIKYKGSDVVKVLERLERLHGLDTNSFDEATQKIVGELQSQSVDEIKIKFTEITMKTQDYLKRLEQVEEAETIG